jgi:hypothetical protein
VLIIIKNIFGAVVGAEVGWWIEAAVVVPVEATVLKKLSENTADAKKYLI